MKRFFGAVICASLFGSVSSFAQGVHAVKRLDGYQCMSLAHLWDGVGPQPAPVHVYDSSAPTATAVGFAAGTVLVTNPARAVGGRLQMLWPNGRTVWIASSEVVPFHVVSDPNAACTPVLLSNGRYGTTGKY